MKRAKRGIGLKDEGFEIKRVLEQLSREIEDYYQDVERCNLMPDFDAHSIRVHLRENYDFETPIPLEQLMNDVTRLMRHGNVQSSHPHYFGLYVPAARFPSIVADSLVALYNPQLGATTHSSAATEIEQFTLQFLASRLGLNPETCSANYTTGGTEANLTAVITALTKMFPDHGDRGVRSLPSLPVMYVSEEAHHSFNRIASMTGLGCSAVRVISVNERFQLDMQQLERQLGADRDEGYAPFLVVGTAGTTSAGIIDPLQELADFCKDQRLWFHVDAACGGAAILSPRLRKHLVGIEKADSITCDAHKWFSVSMGAGMFFCRHKDAVARAFSVRAPYLSKQDEDVIEPYETTMQCSRRFIGLKVFMSIAELGTTGFAEMIEKQSRLADLLQKRLIEKNWLVVTSSPFAVVCFTHERIKSGEISTNELLNRVYANRSVWISATRLKGSIPVLRACITNFRTKETDVDLLITELDKAIELKLRNCD